MLQKNRVPTYSTQSNSSVRRSTCRISMEKALSLVRQGILYFSLFKSILQYQYGWLEWCSVKRLQKRGGFTALVDVSTTLMLAPGIPFSFSIRVPISPQWPALIISSQICGLLQTCLLALTVVRDQVQMYLAIGTFNKCWGSSWTYNIPLERTAYHPFLSLQVQSSHSTKKDALYNDHKYTYVQLPNVAL